MAEKVGLEQNMATEKSFNKCISRNYSRGQIRKRKELTRIFAEVKKIQPANY